jgi:hypothetical protein
LRKENSTDKSKELHEATKVFHFPFQFKAWSITLTGSSDGLTPIFGKEGHTTRLKTGPTVVEESQNDYKNNEV